MAWRRRPTRAALAGCAVLALVAGSGLALAKPQFTLKRATGPVPAGDQGFVSANCPNGTELALGGAQTPTSESDNLTLTTLGRIGQRGWTAAAVEGLLGNGAEVTSIAYCAKHFKRVADRIKTRTIPTAVTGPLGEVTATCKRGARLAFGGFQYNTGPGNETFLASLARDSARRWTASFRSFSGAQVTAIASCSKRAPKTRAVQRSVTVPPDSAGSVQARCPKGSRLVFGGYRAEVLAPPGGFVLLRGLKRKGSRSWLVNATNEDATSAGTLTAIAYCA